MCETKYNTDWKRYIGRVVHFRNFYIAIIIYCVYNENTMLIHCKHVFVILFKFKHKKREETLNQKRKKYLSLISTCVSLKTKLPNKIILEGQISVHTTESESFCFCMGQNLSEFHRQYFENNICRVLIFFLSFILTSKFQCYINNT